MQEFIDLLPGILIGFIPSVPFILAFIKQLFDVVKTKRTIGQLIDLTKNLDQNVLDSGVGMENINKEISDKMDKLFEKYDKILSNIIEANKDEIDSLRTSIERAVKHLYVEMSDVQNKTSILIEGVKESIKDQGKDGDSNDVHPLHEETQDTVDTE